MLKNDVKEFVLGVSFYDFQSLHNKEFQSEIIEVFSEIVKDSSFVEGPYNEKFETDFAEYLQAKHCLLLANGTDAIEIALKAQGVEHGDWVAVPCITFFASAEAVINIGAKVVFVDVDPLTGCFCPNSFERIASSYDLKAFIPVHIYGHPAPIEAIEKLCSEKKIKIIEDGAQAAGGYYRNGKPLGSSDHMTTYSFYPTKNLAAFGDAGAIVTNMSDKVDLIKSIRNHGRSPSGHTLIGRNSRCDHLQAAVLYKKLKDLPKLAEKRRSIAKLYLNNFQGLNLRLPPEELIPLSSWHMFPIGLKSKEQKLELEAFLKDRDIASMKFYEKSLAQEKPLAGTPGEFETSNQFADTTLCMPMNPFLTEDQIMEVTGAVKEFLKG